VIEYLFVVEEPYVRLLDDVDVPSASLALTLDIAKKTQRA
jgi:hypothetical protein